MGLMIAKRALDSELSTPEQISLSRVRQARRATIEHLIPGAQVLTENVKAVENSDVIVLAIKPKSFSLVAAEISNALSKQTLVISVVTGIDIKRLETELDTQNIIRTSTYIGIESGVATT